MTDNENKEILFIGKITASVTHEIKNVLASIKELTGLMEDLVLMSDEFPLKEKFQNTIPRILNQVERGSEITKNFNRFSHIPDNKIEKLNLGSVAEHLVYLSMRFARQKNIKLIIPEENTSVEIETNPLQLYMGCFQVLDFLMNRMNHDGEIRIWAEKSAEDVSIILCCDGELTNREDFLNDIKSSDEWHEAYNIINSFNGSVEFDDSQTSFTIKMLSTAQSDSE